MKISGMNLLIFYIGAASISTVKISLFAVIYDLRRSPEGLRRFGVKMRLSFYFISLL